MSNDSAVIHAIRNEENAELDRHAFHVGSGASLILIVLVIISILCFAALSIVSARADDRLTDRYVEETGNYQTAYNQGQDFIARTDEQLQSIYTGLTAGSSDAREAAYFHAVSRLEDAVDPSDTSLSCYDTLQEILQNTGTDAPSSVLIQIEPVSDTQEYILVLEPLWPDDHGGSCYRVLSARTVITASYDYDTTLNVMK